MESSGSKRTPSRCREWERRRRNKFNDAISKLGEIVKAINKSNNPDTADDVQYPKIEIVEKAIMCLTNCAQEKTQLKAEILALQVKLDSGNSKTTNKDASTQVYFGFAKKRKDGKYGKLLMLKKNNKSKPIKKKPICAKTQEIQATESSQKLPKLLPRLIDKKGTENTVVVLPAPPYIFPQRPILFPPVPPTILLLDQHLQPLNKASVPILNRNNGDTTKTTMVNILPISAYSHPISAIKNKNKSLKLKNDTNKKTAKKPKTNTNTKKELNKQNSPSKQISYPKVPTTTESNTQVTETFNNNKESDKTKVVNKTTTQESNIENCVKSDEHAKLDQITKRKEDNISNKSNEVPINKDKPKCTDSTIKDLPLPVTPTSVPKTSLDNKTTDTNAQATKILTAKVENGPVNKEKDKVPILPLDSSLCDNVVDTRNARLELAEEFLATSPTAAFLMSFPLVSGNRADSPTDDQHHTTAPTNQKDNHRRNDLAPAPPPTPSFEKLNNADVKTKAPVKLNSCNPPNIVSNKQNAQQKFADHVVTKESITNTTVTKTSNTNTVPSVSNENPFLNLPMPSLMSTTCSMADTNFGLEFDCNISKSMPNQSTNYVSSNNIFYKGDPFGSVKSTIYSSSNITSSHDFNGLGLYPCAMDKYSSKNKSEYSSVDENLMKIGTSRLTYDIDLGWSQKSLDFVNCTTTANTFNKDSILTSTSGPYTSTYNPFNPEFHVPLASTANKKDVSTKSNTSFADTITSFYSQPSNLWTEDAPFYTNSNVSKSLPKTHPVQNYPIIDHVQTHLNIKTSSKQYESKIIEPNSETVAKLSNSSANQQIPEKFTKKSPSKMHINWMTSETRSVQNNNGNPLPHVDTKGVHKPAYIQSDHSTKKQDHTEGNYFPISMHNFTTQPAQEEFQVWPSTRPLGTTEISIDRLPINLPTLVGDLALGPHDKNKKVDLANRIAPQSEVQNCGNFLSVTQLMNRSTDNMSSRYQAHMDIPKTMPTKQSLNNFSNESNRKNLPYLDNHVPQPCYVFNDPKLMNSYEHPAQYLHSKAKTQNKSDKTSKTQKNNYSTEALLKGANCTQKVQDNSVKLMMPTQKYHDFSNQDSAVAQVSHFPPMLDYSDNSYAGQQFAGTTLYNTPTNTLSNSFYSNFMPGSSNLMSSNYTGGTFTGDFIDYNQTAECNYTNHKYEELKMRNTGPVYQTEKVTSNYKSSRRESATKHKLECSKKESSKKFQNKKQKVTNEVEEWSDPSHLLWHNKTSSKKHSNLMCDELPLPNYVGNQMSSQYQPEFFNTHLMPSSVPSMSHNMDRSLATFPVTSRANFNLSTIFPEITMKVQ